MANPQGSDDEPLTDEQIAQDDADTERVGAWLRTQVDKDGE